MDMEIPLSSAGVIREQKGSVAGEPGARNIAERVWAASVADECKDGENHYEKREHSKTGGIANKLCSYINR